MRCQEGSVDEALEQEPEVSMRFLARLCVCLVSGVTLARSQEQEALLGNEQEDGKEQKQGMVVSLGIGAGVEEPGDCAKFLDKLEVILLLQ